jgi:hypothetical protein
MNCYIFENNIHGNIRAKFETNFDILENTRFPIPGQFNKSLTSGRIISHFHVEKSDN